MKATYTYTCTECGAHVETDHIYQVVRVSEIDQAIYDQQYKWWNEEEQEHRNAQEMVETYATHYQNFSRLRRFIEGDFLSYLRRRDFDTWWTFSQKKRAHKNAPDKPEPRQTNLCKFCWEANELKERKYENSN